MRINRHNFTLLLLLLICNLNAVSQEIGVNAITELQTNFRGDVNFANQLRINFEVPLSSNISFEAQSLSVGITKEERILNDLQNFSNLDAENLLFTLSKACVKWEINDRNTVYAGIRNMNEDYFISDVTSFFVNASCGIFPTLSSNYNMANYPFSSMGLHYTYQNNGFTYQASLYNGAGYNRFCGRDNLFRICPQSDGVFAITEASYKQHNGSEYFIGAATAPLNTRHTTYGLSVWAYTEQKLSKYLFLIADYGHDFAKDSFCQDFVGVGGKVDLNKVEIGLFTDYAHFTYRNEFATEISAKISLGKYFYFQPAFHLIHINKTETSWHTASLVRFGFDI